MNYKAEFEVLVPEFGEVIVEGELSREEAETEAYAMIKELYPEADSMEVVEITEID